MLIAMPFCCLWRRGRGSQRLLRYFMFAYLTQGPTAQGRLCLPTRLSFFQTPQENKCSLILHTLCRCSMPDFMPRILLWMLLETFQRAPTCMIRRVRTSPHFTTVHLCMDLLLHGFLTQTDQDYCQLHLCWVPYCLEHPWQGMSRSGHLCRHLLEFTAPCALRRPRLLARWGPLHNFGTYCSQSLLGCTMLIAMRNQCWWRRRRGSPCLQRRLYVRLPYTRAPVHRVDFACQSVCIFFNLARNKICIPVPPCVYMLHLPHFMPRPLVWRLFEGHPHA